MENILPNPFKIKLFKALSLEKPVFGQIIPKEPCKDGNGLCTVSEIEATFIEYKGTHSAAHKVDMEKSTTVINSSAKRVLKLQVSKKSRIGKRMILDK